MDAAAAGPFWPRWSTPRRGRRFIRSAARTVACFMPHASHELVVLSPVTRTEGPLRTWRGSLLVACRVSQHMTHSHVCGIELRAVGKGLMYIWQNVHEMSVAISPRPDGSLHE